MCELSLLGLATDGNTFYFVGVAYNIADLVEHSIDLNPDRVALLDTDRELTFPQLEERANRLAQHLRDQGVGPGD